MKMARKIYSVLVIGLMFCSVAGADMIVYGLDVTGQIIGRDELDNAASIPTTELTFGEGGILSLAPLDGGTKYAIGTQEGWIHVKDAFDNTFSNAGSGNFTAGGVGISALVSRADGHVVGGAQDGAVMYRSADNLGLPAPGVVNSYGIFDATPFLSMVQLPNGHHVVATAAGNMWLRNKDDLFSGTVPGGDPTMVAWGSPVNDMAVNANGDITVGLANGGVFTRNFANLGVNVGAGIVSWGAGIAVEELEMLSNGDVVIGLSNGQVHVRSSTNLTVSLGNSITLGGTAITAMEVTSNDNVVLAIGSNGTSYTRQGSNLSAVPVGFTGVDGLVFGQQIDALAAVVPEPATMILLGLGGLGLLRRRKR
jgi:hypothetical protein